VVIVATLGSLIVGRGVAAAAAQGIVRQAAAASA